MPVTTGDSSPVWLRGTLWTLIGLACALQAYEIPNRGIDPDELEHLHAAYCVWRGDLPYRDFFEHHGPALYYLVWPLFKLCGPQLVVLWLARLTMWCCSLATLAVIGQLARRWGGDRTGLLAMGMLAWTTVFHGKGIELRPDVPAMLLLSLAVSQFTYATGGGSWRRFLYVGMLAGLAMLFTQKSIVPAAGIGIAACLARIITRDPAAESIGTVLARVVVPMAAGIAVIWGTTALLFSTAGAAGDLWHSTWYQLWVWPVRSSRWEHFRPTLASDFTVWAAAAVEIAVALRNFRAPETWKEQRGAAAMIAAVCLLSLAFVKATYPQFYLLWMPLLAALAARQIIRLCDHVAERRPVYTLIITGECLVVLQYVLWRRAFSAGFAGALPRLAEPESSNLLVLFALGIAMLAVAVFARRGKWEATVVLVAGLGMGYGALRNVDSALWSNHDQVAAIDAVNRYVPPDGRVLDGFTGYAALRPHAWYYWWINEYSLALVPDEDRDVRLLAQLEESPPAAVLYDRNLRLLPLPVRDWLEGHFEPADPPVMWLPRRDQAR
jgi:hypothetical protein